MSLSKKRDLVHLILAGLFVTNALLGEMMGGKLFTAGPWVMSMGVIPWPIVFLSTDIINEYFGKPGVRRLTLLTVGLLIYAFLVIFAAMAVPAARVSPVQDREFSVVFGQSLWIIVGSIVAFATSQLVDVFVFWLFRDRTGAKHLWLRATGSTAVSQFFDTFIVLGIGFWLPGKLAGAQFLQLAGSNYIYKFLIAVGLTPVIYALHGAIDRYLGKEESERLMEEAAQLTHKEWAA